jgi:hypothetical protein
VHCPSCGEPIELAIDTSVERQRYVEDCPVCCRPMLVSASITPQLEVLVEPENG